MQPEIPNPAERGLIAPAAYRDPALHAQELATLFARQWIFVGLLSELQGLSHRGVKVGARELLIQRDKHGVPRAFLNVCSHRHAQLCKEGLHAGPVRCPYHGWVYSRDGVPVGIPQPKAFPAVVANPQAFSLTEFACESAGEFIFVRLAPTGPSLRAQLGAQFEFLERASASMAGVVDEFRRAVPANWKILIENSLEGYHVPAVHNQTFMQAESMKLEEGEPPVDHLDDPLHSHMDHPAAPAWLARFARSTEPKIGSWAWRFPHYTHHFIFPNLTVTSFMGYSFHIQQFEPTESAVTTIHSRTVGVSFSGQNPVGAKMIERIYADGHAFTAKLFDEDSAICERVQRGLNQAERLAVIGLGIEARVAHFHRAYQSAIATVTAT
jgi:phenylpropionate dioxygenase-like ring-hydroxylating dioxygenase large terminal subunit